MTLVLAGLFVLLRGADFCPAMKVGCGYEHVGQVPRIYRRAQDRLLQGGDRPPALAAHLK